jgi:hypothetical protein
MSESDRPLDAEAAEGRTDDPLADDDLLRSPADAPPAEAGPAPEQEPEAEAQAPESPRPHDPVRRLLPIGWTLVAVIVVAAVLMVIALQRISSEVNRVSCVERAQANYASTAGSNANSAATRLARLGLQVALRKCGT